MKTTNRFWACIWAVCILTVGIVAGAQVPGIFSTIQWTSAVGQTILTNTAEVNSNPSSLTGTSGGFTGYAKNATGDMDFFATNNGASPSFFWYFLLGSTVTAEMFLD